MTTMQDRGRRTQQRQVRRTGRRVLLLAGAAVAAMALIGCSGEGVPTDVTRPAEPLVTLPDDSAPGVEPAPEPTDAPEPTAAPEPEPTAAPEPEPEQPVAVEPVVDGDGTTTEEAIVIGLLILLILLVIGGLVAWLSRRSNARTYDEGALRNRLATISAHTRWVIDQGVPSLLAATDPAQLQSTWSSINTTLIDVQQELNAVAAGGTGDESRASSDLGTALASLRASLDSGYQMRIQHPDDPDLIGATDRSILVQRDHVQRSISSFEIATA